MQVILLITDITDDNIMIILIYMIIWYDDNTDDTDYNITDDAIAVSVLGTLDRL